MFSVNNIYLNFPFSNCLSWRPFYFQFDADLHLRMLPLFKQSIEVFKSDKENETLLKHYSDQFKLEYSEEILISENNLLKSDLINFHQSSQISTKSLTKLMNLRKAINFLFPDVFIPNLNPEDFNEDLAIKINKIIGKDLFNNAGKYRINGAKASQENYYYLEPNQIQDEMKKLFDKTRQEFISFKNEQNSEFLIKLGSQFLIHFLTIHPFQNGNGRVARLLLSYLLSSVTIVPLSIYPISNYSNCKNGREIYLQCLRDERNKSPASESNLASLILESAFINLEDMCIYLDIYPNI